MKLRVAHITTIDMSLHDLLLNQLDSLRQDGYEIIGVSTPGPRTAALVEAGVRHIPIEIKREISLVHDLVSLYQLFRLMRREKFTIVHTHNAKPGLIGQVAARLAGVPVIVNTVHGYHFHEYMSPTKRRFFITLEKVAASCSDVILSQNSEDMQVAIREHICPPDKIKHLGNGIDLSRFDPDQFTAEDIQAKRTELGIPPDALVIGFIGRLAAKRKGVLDLLSAGQQVSKHFPNVRLLIIGEADPEKLDAVQPSVAREYGIEDQCIFLGRQPNDLIPILLKQMDVFVLPSLLEGMPRALMEASAMGVPIVATDVKGNRETVEDGRNGVLVPLGDVEALTNAIMSLLNDREKAQRMGDEGQRIASERFDERLVFERVKCEYRRILADKGFNGTGHEEVI